MTGRVLLVGNARYELYAGRFDSHLGIRSPTVVEIFEKKRFPPLTKTIPVMIGRFSRVDKYSVACAAIGTIVITYRPDFEWTVNYVRTYGVYRGPARFARTRCRCYRNRTYYNE